MLDAACGASTVSASRFRFGGAALELHKERSQNPGPAAEVQVWGENAGMYPMPGPPLSRFKKNIIIRLGCSLMQTYAGGAGGNQIANSYM